VNYQWRRNGSLIEGATNSALTLENVQLADAAEYDVAVTETESVLSEAAKLIVVVSPSSSTNVEFSTATFTVQTAGYDHLEFQWKHASCTLLCPCQPWYQGSSDPLAEFNSSTLSLSGLIRYSQGFYIAKVTAPSLGLEITCDPAELTVIDAPDLNGDLRTDIVWQHTDGRVAAWLMDGTNFLSAILLRDGKPVGPGWQIKGLADLNQDGQADFIWHNTNGAVAVWFMNGTNILGVSALNEGKRVSPGWDLQFVLRSAPENSDIYTITNINSAFLWQHTNGSTALWHMHGTNRTSTVLVNQGYDGPARWTLDASTDQLVWRHISGFVAYGWLYREYFTLLNDAKPVPLDWRLAGGADFNHDGNDDLLWQHTDGRIAVWFLDGDIVEPARIGTILLRPDRPVAPGWRIVAPR
jgi:hypothetical protein